MTGFKTDSLENIEGIKVTDADNSANETIADVIGNKDDTVGGSQSLIDYSKTAYYHVHSPAVVYPRASDPITVTAGNTGAWSEGAKVEIIPQNTITKPFDIHVDLYPFLTNQIFYFLFRLDVFSSFSGCYAFFVLTDRKKYYQKWLNDITISIILM